jgi:chromate reductase, NAD(P)H dehydrogenase (quinone)
MTTGSILIISGTNRPGSKCLMVARTLERYYREEKISAQLLDLVNLPVEIFAPTVAYATKPPGFYAIQDQIIAAAGLHIVTPEYHGSFAGVLKYFLDMLDARACFDEKPVALVGEASGMWGGLRAVEQLQLIFSYCRAHIYRDRVMMPQVKDHFAEDGTVTDEQIAKRLRNQVIGFAQYAGLLVAAKKPTSSN